jgi:antitoxin ParD1/3/4
MVFEVQIGATKPVILKAKPEESPRETLPSSNRRYGEERLRRGMPRFLGMTVGFLVNSSIAIRNGCQALLSSRKGGASMNVSLTPQLEEMIHQKVESGLYNNASEVVREALRLLDQRDRKLQWLREAVAIGDAQIARGEAIEITPEDIAQMQLEAMERVRTRDLAKNAAEP